VSHHWSGCSGFCPEPPQMRHAAHSSGCFTWMRRPSRAVKGS
jgi:hypothetical protein